MLLEKRIKTQKTGNNKNVIREIKMGLQLHQGGKTMDPLISIIMATYNRADYIQEALDSIKRQTFKD